MRIKLVSVLVDDQQKALEFYTNVLGFVKKVDFPVGPARWLTVVAESEPNATELLLEPMGLPAAQTYQSDLRKAGIPLTAFTVRDIHKTTERMKQADVRFTTEPTVAGPVMIAVFDDTCGNLIQLVQPPRFGDQSAVEGPLIRTASVLVDDQERALHFYTEVLGFKKNHDVPAGEHRWLTVVSPLEPDGAELLLEPMGFPPAQTFQKALREAGIPLTAFAVSNVRAEYERLLSKGVKFTGEPTSMETTTIAIFEDTCGNLIQIFEAP